MGGVFDPGVFRGEVFDVGGSPAVATGAYGTISALEIVDRASISSLTLVDRASISTFTIEG